MLCCMQELRNSLARQSFVPMLSNNAEYVVLGEGSSSSPKLDKHQKVSIIPLVFFNLL